MKQADNPHWQDEVVEETFDQRQGWKAPVLRTADGMRYTLDDAGELVYWFPDGSEKWVHAPAAVRKWGPRLLILSTRLNPDIEAGQLLGDKLAPVSNYPIPWSARLGGT
jgi:hypothetical protein